ncbi:MAG: tRNA adenosine(34) deaminase TadA [Nitrospinota bacterium]
MIGGDGAAAEAEDRRWMALALEEAREALATSDVPVGAVVVAGGQAIARGRNRRQALGDPTAHAEVEALREAAGRMGDWRLEGCTLYVTLEPCAMCTGAAVNARVGRLVFGAYDPKGGACYSLYRLPEDARLNHRFPVVGGVLEAECGALLSEFFRERRGKD